MIENWVEGSAAERYRELLEAQDGRAPDDTGNQVAEVVARARQQLTMRDVVALGFGGLVGVLVSLLANVARHLNRRTRKRGAALRDMQ